MSSNKILIPGWAMSGSVFSSFSGVVLPCVTAHTIRYLETMIQTATDIHLTGVSLGGYVAIQMAIKYPEKVSGLTLLGMRPFYPAKTIDLSIRSIRKDKQRFLESFYQSCFHQDANLQRFLERNKNADLETLLFGLEMLKSAQLSDVDGLSLPIEWVHGVCDQVAPYDEVLGFLEARGVVLDGLNDLGHLDMALDS